MAGRLGIHEGGQGVRGKKDAGMDFSGGVNNGTSEILEQRWSGLSLRGVGLQGQCSLRRSTLERIGSHISDLNLGLKLIGGLTFGPNTGGLIRVSVVLLTADCR